MLTQWHCTQRTISDGWGAGSGGSECVGGVGWGGVFSLLMDTDTDDGRE